MTLTDQLKALPLGGRLVVPSVTIKRVHNYIQRAQRTGQWYAARTLTTGVEVRRVE